MVKKNKVNLSPDKNKLELKDNVDNMSISFTHSSLLPLVSLIGIDQRNLRLGGGGVSKLSSEKGRCAARRVGDTEHSGLLALGVYGDLGSRRGDPCIQLPRYCSRCRGIEAPE